MSDDYKKPDSWAMPDELAKRVSETLNNKLSTPEDELADALEEMARDIALIEPDPESWAGWVIYLLEQMEIEAEKRKLIPNYGNTLVDLVEKFQNRIEAEKW